MTSKIILIVFYSLLVLSSCRSSQPLQKSSTQLPLPMGTVDYQNPNYWAALPTKWDPSDSVPAPLKNNYQQDTSVDVFFIHPTSYTDKHKPTGWNASIDDLEINQKTDLSSILFQASSFNEAGKIYAPRYRQANLACYYPESRQDSIDAMAAFELAYSDVKAAFQYYLTHYNQGRPIIIAAHSQGTTHGKRLVKEFFDGTPLQKQLVAAYLVGMYVEANYFTQIKPCNTPAQFGCALSWRTYQTNYIPDFVTNENSPAIIVNPITWDANKPVANRFANKGGVLLKFNKIVPNVAAASIAEKILWTEKPHFFGNILYRTKNYHVGDINLYYLSVRENAKLRSQAFQQANSRKH